MEWFPSRRLTISIRTGSENGGTKQLGFDGLSRIARSSRQPFPPPRGKPGHPFQWLATERQSRLQERGHRELPGRVRDKNLIQTRQCRTCRARRPAGNVCQNPPPSEAMNSQNIIEASRATLAGILPFPDLVGTLLGEGVECYHVDFIAMRKTFYGTGDEMVMTPINYSELPPVAREFDLETLRATIQDSQLNGQKFREFTGRAMAAGVHGYMVFLRGQRVTYWGRQGDLHTEYFPKNPVARQVPDAELAAAASTD